jgi:hypothetical protein
VKQPDASVVIKYFDLIDEFIRVRSCSDEVVTDLTRQPVTNKASYRRRVVEVCVPDFHGEIVKSVGRLDEDYDPEIVEELLYQICIDVNPSLEIHQVSLPSMGGQEPENALIPRSACPQERQSLRSGGSARARPGAASAPAAPAAQRPSPAQHRSPPRRAGSRCARRAAAHALANTSELCLVADNASSH